MKYLLSLFLFLFVFATNAQIVTEKSNAQTKEKSEKSKANKEESKKKINRTNEKSGITIYAGVSPAYTYRTLKINKGLFAAPLGYREDEKAVWTTSYEVGVRSKIGKGFDFSIGAAFFKDRESFTYEKKDSVFDYTNTYRKLGFPLRIGYSYGKNISFYAALGIIPSAFLGMKREETILDINNDKKTEKSIHRDRYNTFLVDAVVDIGARFKLGQNVGIFILAEGRRQLTNNFNKQSPYIRKPFSIGLTAGLEIYL